MPLGFSKSIFSHKVAAAAGGGTDGYWYPNGSLSSNTGAFAYVGSAGTTPGTETDVTVAFWFRGYASEQDNVSNANLLRFGWSPDGENGFQLVFNNAVDKIVAFWKGTSNSTIDNPMIATSAYADIEASLLDGNWHHIHMTWDQNSTTGTHMYIDGSDQAATKNTSGTSYSYNNDFCAIQDGTRFVSNNTTAEFVNPCMWDMGQLWIDFSLQTDNTKFYNSGFVDLGTDGTGSGLSQPQIYVYVDDAGVLQQGGTLGWSAGTSATGTGGHSLGLQASTGSTELSQGTSRSARTDIT